MNKLFDNIMTEERWKELCERVKVQGMDISYDDFTVGELTVIINNARISDNERKGAVMFYVEKKRMVDIATKLGYSLSTLKYHKKIVSQELKKTCCRLFK